MSLFGIEESNVGAVIVVELSGKFLEDGSKALADLVRTKNPSDKIVFDCTKVTFGNSSFIGAFMLGRKSRQEQKGEIVFCGIVSESLRERMEISQLGKVIRIFQTRDLAVASLSQ